ncbi:hypothetical protein BDV96DRAFT_596136 [Lophiotrema nucula]|uniref:BTB domain-containing protein n=1 Tax=Lophiotrema nucula TaxID=690887 RepID=A0A6A5ZJF1_9PLEO|nr:hypothetical protein BDV96DRAFT_596136 [Lophiotrema nucula]
MSPESQHSGPAFSRQQQAVNASSQASTQPGIDEILIEGEARTINNLEGYNDIPDFQPFQNLLKTPITVKYGKALQGGYTIHLELVCCYSSTIRDLFVEADELNRAYAVGASIRKNLKALLPPQTPYGAFQVEKAMNLIIRCLKNYPLLEHQTLVRSELEQATDRVFHNKDLWKSPIPNATSLKKKISDNPIEDVRIRLQCLTSEAVCHVTEALYRRLFEIKNFEVRSAKMNKRKAAAQRILYLPQFEADAIGAFVGWIYQKEKLNFDTAKGLCDLYILADALDVKDLAATCLNKLASAAYDAVNQARENGTGIRALLQKAQSPEAAVEEPMVDPLADIVPTVFEYVQQAPTPPQVLETLVIDAIADSKDEELIEFLRPSLDLPMALKLCQAFMVRSCKVDTPEPATKTEA